MLTRCAAAAALYLDAPTGGNFLDLLNSMDHETLTEIAEAAVTAERLTGCPAELLVAQCALESAWLRDAPGNNCFGIKAYRGCHGRQLLATSEWFNEMERDRFLEQGEGRTAVLVQPLEVNGGRKKYRVRDYFATFACLADCFTIRARMWDHGRYSAAAKAYRESRNFEAYVRAIAPIYATDPKYARTVLRIAEQKNVKAALEAAMVR